MAQLFGLARIGRDAEVRFLADGTAVTNVSLAFSYGRKGQDGNRLTQWVDAAMFGKRAEALAPYLLKRGVVSVTVDDIHIETYQGKNGEGTKLVGSISQIELAGGGQAAGETQQQRPAPTQQQRQAPKPAPNFSDMDDDIPFIFSNIGMSVNAESRQHIKSKQGRHSGIEF